MDAGDERTDAGSSDGTPVFAGGELAEGQSRKFHLRRGERELECFAVRHRGELHAFVNQCRHVAMSLDWVENQFFTEDREFLLCPTHGALYLPDTGECVAGPPCGKALFRVRLTERDGQVLAFWPDPAP